MRRSCVAGLSYTKRQGRAECSANAGTHHMQFLCGGDHVVLDALQERCLARQEHAGGCVINRHCFFDVIDDLLFKALFDAFESVMLSGEAEVKTYSNPLIPFALCVAAQDEVLSFHVFPRGDSTAGGL